MTTCYVDNTNGNDANSGLTVALAKKTLNGAEDTPVAAGDLIHVAPDVYRETWTWDVSGTAGNQIEFRGDPMGVIFGRRGVVRLTGSDNDQAAVRDNCIVGLRNYRTLSNFQIDSSLLSGFATGNASNNNIVQRCVFLHSTSTGYAGLSIRNSASITNWTIQNCVFFAQRGSNGIVYALDTSQVDNSASLIQNCLFIGGSACILTNRMGGLTIKNCTFISQGAVGTATAAVVTQTLLTGGVVVTVNNCIIQGCGQGFGSAATATVDITENYNNLYGNNTDRTNVNTGANSTAYPMLQETWPFFLAMLAAAPQQMVSVFDLSSWSQLINLAGTSPSATDLRGTAVQGAQREWGALEYDTSLLKTIPTATTSDGARVRRDLRR